MFPVTPIVPGKKLPAREMKVFMSISENLRFSPQSQTYRLWELSNVRDKQKIFSRVDLVELDCRNKRNRWIIALVYPKFFGQGDLLMGCLLYTSDAADD